jgi:hypothetical protein
MPRPAVQAATETVTALHFFGACSADRPPIPPALSCERARPACLESAGSSLELEVVLVDYAASSALFCAGPRQRRPRPRSSRRFLKLCCLVDLHWWRGALGRGDG